MTQPQPHQRKPLQLIPNPNGDARRIIREIPTEDIMRLLDSDIDLDILLFDELESRRQAELRRQGQL